MPNKLQNISPHTIFKAVAESLQAEVNVVASQNSEFTILTGDFSNVSIEINNTILVDCGDMQGYYTIYQNTDEYIKIKYTGNVSNGTVSCGLYFRWGSLKMINEYVQKSQEYPLIALILPDPYNIDFDLSVPYFIDDTFKLLFIDKYRRASNEAESETQRIYDQCVSDIEDLTINYVETLKEWGKPVMSVDSVKRSAEIPYGITIGSNQAGKTQGVFDYLNAGSFLELRVKISKQYVNC